mgnify:CR=1 FL=1
MEKINSSKQFECAIEINDDFKQKYDNYLFLNHININIVLRNKQTNVTN